MLIKSAIPNRFAVCYQPGLESSCSQMVDEICLFLQENGASVIHTAPLNDPALAVRIQQREFDVFIALGGDGTMLRSGHLCAPNKLPILGINFGRFGFLTEVKDAQWRPAIQNLFNGDYRIEERMMLQVEHWRGNELLGTWDALNELVVTRGVEVRPIHLQASVDDFPLSNFVADGLIVATPTGSTAYALAAGGPIMPPELRNILIIPVAPHLSVDRAVILSQGANVRITVSSRPQAVLSVDGQTPVPLNEEEHVQAFAAENMVSFIRFQETDYFYRNLFMYMEQNPSIKNIGL